MKNSLDAFILKHEEKNTDTFISYQIVSFKLGVEKDFSLYDGEDIVKIDEISTLRKRLKQSMSNTVPFYIYINTDTIGKEMKEDLKNILLNTFPD